MDQAFSSGYIIMSLNTTLVINIKVSKSSVHSCVHVFYPIKFSISRYKAFIKLRLENSDVLVIGHHCGL